MPRVGAAIMSLALFFGLCVIIAAVVIRFGIFLTARLGLLDHPGGHKQHGSSTPFVGGFGLVAIVMTVLYCGSTYFPGLSLHPLRVMAVGAAILFVTGLVDDMWHLGFKSRLLIQAVVALGMVYWGGVELATLGRIFHSLPINLGIFAVPFTVFATIGLINALNMIDGIDGLSGSLSFISLALVAAVAAAVHSITYLIFAVALMGGVAGFLYYNLRYSSNKQARVFLGDNGSMLLGFVFAWLFIALSQGERPAMTPVTALWFFAVPLMDTVSVMLRRIRSGKSPFHADRNHLHHLFMRAGFRVSDTVCIVSLLQLVLGGIGIAGLWLKLPEYLMFWFFIGVFATYAYVIFQPRHFVLNLRRLNAALGLIPVPACGVFVGYLEKEAAKKILDVLAEKFTGRYDYRFSLHQVDHQKLGDANTYALIEIDGGFDEAPAREILRLMSHVKNHFADGSHDLQLRLFMRRNKENERRIVRVNNKIMGCRREKDRRAKSRNAPIYTDVLSCNKRRVNFVRV